MIRKFVTKDSKGKLRIVTVEYSKLSDDPESYCIYRKTGLLNGKITRQPDLLISEGKAKRTIFEQTELVYKSECKKFLDKGYKEISPDSDYDDDYLLNLVSQKTNQKGVLKPMLAKQIADVNPKSVEKVKLWYASPKLDGVRCEFYYQDGVVYSASRGGDNYDISTEEIRLNPKLIEFFEKHPDVILDGELYKHGKTLQEISSETRQQKYPSKWMEYYIYDIVDESLTFDKRNELLKQFANELQISYNPFQVFNEDDLRLQIVPQIKVGNIEEINKMHNTFVEQGYEGCVIRDPNKTYKCGGRDNRMLKVKMFTEGTFKVIGIEQGLRQYADMSFIMQMKDGRTFKATPYGDINVKKDYTDNFEALYKNKIGEVKYFHLSDTGIPNLPNFRAFRFDLTNKDIQ